MKKIIYVLFLALGLNQFFAQTNADCINSIPLCNTPSFTFFTTAGNGAVNDIPAGNNISNPSTNPNPPNSGCLLSGENVPQWLLLTIGNTGTLEFVFGAGNSSNPQVGFYDWAMWPYNANTCANIMNNTLPPIRCNWNGSMSGGTGIASAGNIPPGGSSTNFEAPLAVNACQQYIICISNYSGVNTLVSFQSLGTASLSCSPSCNPNYTICAGANATIVPVNFAGLTNPTYSIQPGGASNTTGSFVVNPSTTTTYTTYITGSNGTSVQTTTSTSTVSVNATPVLAPTFTQATCSNTNNAVNLGLSFNGTPNGYTVTWNPMPASVTSNTQTFASNLNAGVTSVTITTPGGCNTSTSFTMSTAVVPTMTLNNNTGSYSLTCVTPSIDMVASSNYTNGTISYLWSSLSFTANTPSVSITQTGTYNICAYDAVTSCSTCETFTIFQNQVAPTSTVTPVSQVITCGSSQATFTGTALGPTVNIVHEWYCPQAPPPTGPPSFTSNNVVSPFSTVCGPGTYTYIIRDLTNGCIVTKTVSITSVSGFPTFNTSSTSNYSVGCSPLNQTTLCIVNAVSVNSAAVQFLFLPPGTPSAIPLPTTSFGAQSCTTLATPGQWTLVAQDPSNGCQTALTVPILQNTISPNVLATFAPASQTLTCFNPTILATGTSSTPGTTISWQVPSTPPVIPTYSIVLGPSTGPATHTSNLTYANYTVIATNTVNACVTTSVVQVNQNFRAPIPAMAVGNPSVITCKNLPVVLSYTNNAQQSNIPGAVAVVTSWAGPAPQASLSVVAQYSAYIAGPYTLTVQDNKNGCYGTKTWTVAENKQPPVLSPPNNTVILGCGTTSVGLQPNVTGGNANHYFWFRDFPDNAAISPLSATTPTLGTSAGTIFVDMPGSYVYIATNTVTGCKAIGTFTVIAGDLTANFTPNQTSGFAPLTVNFTNNSGSTSTSTIISLWSFGNGISQTTTTNISPSTTYTAPGTYTVYLMAQQGACVDTAARVIRVDIPSKLEAPNVFTPNGDGANDEFFLRTQNVTEITAYIYDRWGNKVYEVSSDTGNIAWDGKTLDGKECAAGTYFYIIKGKGKDGAEYDQKGNVSLYR